LGVGTWFAAGFEGHVGEFHVDGVGVSLAVDRVVAHPGGRVDAYTDGEGALSGHFRVEPVVMQEGVPQETAAPSSSAIASMA
jgi:hypothetical protein